MNGVCATILDSSLRCAAFRMTGKGRCVQNDRIDLLLRSKTLCVSNVNRTYSLLPLMSPNTKDSAEEPTVQRRPTELTVIAVWLAGLASTYTESATAPTKDRIATTMANPTTTMKSHAPERGSVTLQPYFSCAIVNPHRMTRMTQGRPHYPQRGNRPCDEWMALWFQGGGSSIRIHIGRVMDFCIRRIYLGGTGHGILLSLLLMELEQSLFVGGPYRSHLIRSVHLQTMYRHASRLRVLLSRCRTFAFGEQLPSKQVAVSYQRTRYMMASPLGSANTGLAMASNLGMPSMPYLSRSRWPMYT